MLMVEGLMILSCLIPALHFGDGTWRGITLSGLFTLNVGLLMLVRYHRARTMHDRRLSYLLVVLMRGEGPRLLMLAAAIQTALGMEHPHMVNTKPPPMMNTM